MFYQSEYSGDILQSKHRPTHHEFRSAPSPPPTVSTELLYLLSFGLYKIVYTHTLSGTNHKAKLAISVSGWLGRYTNVEYLQSIPAETRTITVPSLSGL